MRPMLPVRRPSGEPQYTAYDTEPHDDFTAARLMGSLRRHPFVILACVLVAVALAGAYTLSATPVYEASSMLRLEEQQVNLPQLVQQLSTENEISTEIEVLQRRSAAVPVIDSLGLRARVVSPRGGQSSRYFTLVRVAPDVDTLTLAFHPQGNGQVAVTLAGGREESASRQSSRVARAADTVSVAGVTLVLKPAATTTPDLRVAVTSMNAAVREFSSKLKISRPARDADLIAVNVRSSDPIEAAAAANLLADGLIANRQAVQRTRTGSTVGFLEQQLDSLGTQLRTAEDALQAYRERAGVVDANEQARTQVGRLAQIEADRGGVEAERDALAALLKQMRTDTERGVAIDSSRARRLIAFPTLFRNQAASELLGSLAQVENERATLLTRRTAQDPDVLALTARIRALDAQLQNIAETYLQGLTNQVTALAGVAKRFGGSLDSLPAKEVETARLERSVRVQQELYTLIQTRLKEAQITEAMKDPSIRVVDRAVAPDKPSWPVPLLNFGLAPILGLLVGIVLALVKDSTDHAVRSRADVIVASGLPILGAVPRVRGRKRLGSRAHGLKRLTESASNAMLATSPPAVNGPPASRMRALLANDRGAPPEFVEAFNQLHANLALAHEEQPLKVVVISSPLPGEGKTLAAVNYALTLAGQGFRVLLIDADLRCGLVNEIFGCAREPGMAELLSGTADFEQAARHVSVGDAGVLTIVPSGKRVHAPGRLLVVDRVRELLDSVSHAFDFVIVDSPPVNLLADTAVLGAAADGVLLVVRAGRTRLEALRYAVEQLTAARAPIVGALLNDIDARRNGDDDSYRYLDEVRRYTGADDRLAQVQ